MRDTLTFMEQLAQGIAEIQRIPELSYQYNPRKCVYEYERMRLYHYQPQVKKPHTIPVLVVFATVNRPEILDLFPDHSFIGGLLKNGMDVYLLDWGYPQEEDSDLSLSDYIANYLHQCVEWIIEKSQKKQINLLGVCQGGLISLCYAILFNHIKNLVLISTPIDCHTRDNTVAKLLKKIKASDMVFANGNVSGAWLTQFFISLRPFELIGKKYLRFMDHIHDPEWVEKFLRVEKWLHDAPDQTGASFIELVDEMYHENKLVKGRLNINGKKIDLSTLTIPVLNVMGREDEIVPMSASRALKKYITSADYSQKIFSSGHIGIYISDKVGERMPKFISAWYKKRGEA